MTHLLRTLIVEPPATMAGRERSETTPASEEAVRLALRLREPRSASGGRALLFAPASPGGDASRMVGDAVRGLLELHEGPVLVMDLRATAGDAAERDRYSDIAVVTHPFAGREDTISYAASAEFAGAMERARRTYAFVLCIGEPVSSSVETLIAAAACDGVILAVTPGRTTRSDVQRATDQLRRGRAHVAGFVVEGRAQEREA